MVTWAGIENVTPKLPPVWLWKYNGTDNWKPLRKVDCQKLNKSKGKQKCLIENSRATADPVGGKIKQNFTVRPDRILLKATWFLVPSEGGQQALIPMAEVDATIVETFYKRCVHEASLPQGNGLQRLEREKIPLEDDDDYNVVLQRKGSNYSFKMTPATSWFKKSWDLQRGYGSYTIPGEVEEEMLGPVKHVVFVIHGIGEAERSGNESGISASNSLENVITDMRLKMQTQQVDEWVRECDTAISQELPAPAPPNRVEFIPIYWYERLQSSSDSLSTSLKATTLATIPALRQLANDLLFEVLTYLSPPFCHATLESCTDQIIDNYNRFKSIHSGYNGTFSLMGHSLGSVICWDLLAILKEKQEELSKSVRSNDTHGINITPDKDSTNVLYNQLSGVGIGAGRGDSEDGTMILGSYGPSLPKRLDKTLPFIPEFTIFFGSPLGLFLTLRGVHPIFDALRGDDENTDDSNKESKSDEETSGGGRGNKKKGNEPNPHRVSPFTLPSGSMHNLFHPNDAVAYRLEPLLLPHGTDDIPPPVYLTREGKGLRFHVKALHLGETLQRSFTETSKSISIFVEDNINNPVQRLFGKEPPERPEEEEEVPLRFPLAGERGMGRVDFQLQPPVIDNKYLAVAAAHSSYFSDADIVDYLIDLTTRHNSRGLTIRRHMAVSQSTLIAEALTDKMPTSGEEKDEEDEGQEGSTSRTEDSARIIAV